MIRNNNIYGIMIHRVFIGFRIPVYIPRYTGTMLFTSVAVPDPGSGAFLTGIRDE